MIAARTPVRLRSVGMLGLVLLLTLSACSSDASPNAAAPTVVANAPSATAELEPAATSIPVTEAPAPPAVSDDEVHAAFAAFSLTPSSTAARAAVEAASANGSERWVPWLLDLLRFNVSSGVSREIGGVLESITGIPSEPRIPNMINFGAWSQNRGLDGGDGYRQYKSAIYERFDPAFGSLLASVQDQAEVAAIQWGGVPLGGIPELNDPERVPVSRADWMVDEEVVLGVVENGEAVAYPLRILARHELVNDTVGGDSLSIIYCTLCRSGLVYERDVAGQTLTFLTSGLLLNSNKIMYDPETETLWHHLRGLGIGGGLIGTELTLRSVRHARWGDWIEEFPDSEVLTLPLPIFFDEPERPPISYDYTPGEAYRSYYESTDVWFPVSDAPDIFDQKTEVLGIGHNGDAVALDIELFNREGAAAEITVGDAVFLVEPTGVGARVTDESGEPVITEQSFWFAWFANNPETRTWPNE